eukprot:234326_1
MAELSSNSKDNSVSEVSSVSSPQINEPNVSSKRRIQQLSEDVVNRIAAGEVIQRPSSALKELLENSLDAQATSIEVSLKDGGLKVLMIVDNGTGIHKDDFEILCRRHTTSKIKKFEDLQDIATFGFRGEALASVSHVSHVTITSMTAGQNCAYRASYKDGEIFVKPDAKKDPVPCAGVKGTQIKMEDLFFNVPIRKQALSRPSEEYNRCLDVVSRYAVHNSHSRFSCKKVGSDKSDVNTMARGRTLEDSRAAIRTIYGREIARELMEVTGADESVGLEFKGLVSNVNYSTKKLSFILFINERLVDCSSLRKSLLGAYGNFLAKRTHPFIYLALKITPQNVDVNVHPTKREVMFLHEEEICDSIHKAIEQKLASANASRTYATQPKLSLTLGSGVLGGLGPDCKNRHPADSGSIPQSLSADCISSSSAASTNESQQASPSQSGVPSASGTVIIQSVNGDVQSAVSRTEKRADNRLVRVDARQSRLESFVRTKPASVGNKENRSSQNNGKRERQEGDDITESVKMVPSSKRPRNNGLSRPPRMSQLSSINTLLDKIEAGSHPGLSQVLQRHTFVGCVNEVYALVQHETKLYLIHVPRLSEKYMYERVLRGFGQHTRVRLSEPASITELVELALQDSKSGYSTEDGDKNEIADYVSKLLCAKADMLNEYFAVEISSDGKVCALPALVRGYTPALGYLPTFVLKLAEECDWDEESRCFESVSTHIAKLYAVRPGYYLKGKDGNADDSSSDSLKWTIEHTLFPHFRQPMEFSPPRHFANDGTVVEIAALENLYKIFERC